MVLESSIKVGVRARPLSTREISDGCQSCVAVPENCGHEIILGETRQFHLDYIFSDETSQSEIYQKSVFSMIQSLFSGYNVTVLAYGQTGSGKTYTMGTSYTNNELSESAGIIPRTIKDIFSYLDDIRNDNTITVTVTFLEVYNEEVYDLLSRNKELRNVREENQDIKIPNLVEINVSTPDEIFRLLSKGSDNRSVGSTAMNEESSRSHAIFTLQINIIPNEEGEPVFSKLHLVDLAGSERASKTGATGDRFKEGVNINKGLLVLGSVISALVDREKSNRTVHIPYRESKLTRILQDSLGGNTKTLMLACISPADNSFSETTNTLHYAVRARQIQNRPVMNKVDPSQSEIYKLKAQVTALTAQLRKYESGSPVQPNYNTTSSISLSSSNLQVTEIYKKNIEIMKLNREKENLIEEYEEEMQKRNELLKRFYERLESNSENIENFNELKDDYEKLINSENNQTIVECEEDEEEEEDDDEEGSVADLPKTQLSELHLELKNKTNILEIYENELNRMRGNEEKTKELENKIRELENEKRSNITKGKNNEEMEFKISEYRRQVIKLNALKKEKERKTEEIFNLRQKIQELKTSIIKVEKDMRKERNFFKKELAMSKKEFEMKERNGQKIRAKLEVKTLQQERQTAAWKRKYEHSVANEKRLKDLFERQNQNSAKRMKGVEGVGPHIKGWIKQSLELASQKFETRHQYQSLQTERRKLTAQLRELPLPTFSINSSGDNDSETNDDQSLIAQQRDALQQEIDEINQCINKLQESQLNQYELDFEDNSCTNNPSDKSSQEQDMVVANNWNLLRSFNETKVAVKLLFSSLIKERNRGDLANWHLTDTKERLESSEELSARLFNELKQAHDDYQYRINTMYANTKTKRKITMNPENADLKRKKTGDSVYSDTDSVSSRRSSRMGSRCKCKNGCKPSRCGCIKTGTNCTIKCGCRNISCNIMRESQILPEISEMDVDVSMTQGVDVSMTEANGAGVTDTSSPHGSYNEDNKENQLNTTFSLGSSNNKLDVTFTSASSSSAVLTDQSSVNFNKSQDKNSPDNIVQPTRVTGRYFDSFSNYSDNF